MMTLVGDDVERNTGQGRWGGGAYVEGCEVKECKTFIVIGRQIKYCVSS